MWTWIKRDALLAMIWIKSATNGFSSCRSQYVLFERPVTKTSQQINHTEVRTLTRPSAAHVVPFGSLCLRLRSLSSSYLVFWSQTDALTEMFWCHWTMFVLPLTHHTFQFKWVWRRHAAGLFLPDIILCLFTKKFSFAGHVNMFWQGKTNVVLCPKSHTVTLLGGLLLRLLRS